MVKRLYRTKKRQIGGVCGGVANYLDLDPVVVRLVAALTTIFFCCTPVLVYLTAWLVIPEEPAPGSEPT